MGWGREGRQQGGELKIGGGREADWKVRSRGSVLLVASITHITWPLTAWVSQPRTPAGSMGGSYIHTLCTAMHRVTSLRTLS